MTVERIIPLPLSRARNETDSQAAAYLQSFLDGYWEMVRLAWHQTYREFGQPKMTNFYSGLLNGSFYALKVHDEGTPRGAYIYQAQEALLSNVSICVIALRAGELTLDDDKQARKMLKKLYKAEHIYVQTRTGENSFELKGDWP